MPSVLPLRRPSVAFPWAVIVLAALSSAPPSSVAAQPLAGLPGCDPGDEKTSTNTSIKDDDGNRRWRISWANDRCSIDMRAEGRFEFERDLSDIRTMDRGAFFEIDVRRPGDRRQYEVSRQGESIERRYFVNRQEQPIDAEARRFISSLILELERRSGFAAHSRVSDLLRDGGPDAVMDEIRHLGTDYVQGRYLTIMLDSTRLQESHVRRAIGLAGDELSSDYTHSSFLVALGGQGYVTTPLAAEFVRSTEKIRSDYQRGRALKAVLSLRDLPAPVIADLVGAARSFSSDHQRAELLLATARVHGLPNGSARDAYLDAARRIRSDYEKHRVLEPLITSELTDEQLLALLGVAQSIDSDYQLAQLLVALSESRTLEGRTRDAYLAATETINSDHQRRRALVALVDKRARGSM